jgi:hypothetical protein
MPQQPQSWGGDAAPPFFDARDPRHAPAPMGMQQQPGGIQGYDPMMPGPQSNPGHFPSSGQQPVMQPQPGYPMQGGGYGQHPGGPMGGPQPMGGQPPWMMAQGPGPAGQAPSKFTPQVIMLVSVGAVCLAIFIIGIVLFVTTKF